MSYTRWEYKVAFVENWERTSIEGHEAGPESGERQSGFGRRFLNGLGVDGWELVGIQHTMPGRAYFVFKRPLADGAEPDLSVAKREAAPAPDGERQPPVSPATPNTPEVVSL